MPLTSNSFIVLLGKFVAVYWRTLILLLCPILLLPLIITNNTEMYKCLYVIILMGVFWVTEALPLAVTGMLPLALYPLLGILNTDETVDCYMNDTTMMFLGSLVIAIVIESSGLHMRIALLMIKYIGCSHRNLSFGLFGVTMFISMWISNTAATAMMIPIIETVLGELEAQGLGKMFELNDSSPEEEIEGVSIRPKKPTNCTLAYYLSASYASSIGGIGTLVGTGTNLTFKGIFEERFKNSPGINFASWMMYSVPAMILMGFFTWIWLQVMYMGLFKPKSKDARAIDIGEEGEKITTAVIHQRYKDLGVMTWYESIVGILFVIAVLLWFFRKPDFIQGWPPYVTNLVVKDSTVAICLTILLFVIPSRLDFLNAFHSEENKRPTKSTPGLITWAMIHNKMHWNLLFVLGGGFAIAAGSTNSGLSKMLGNSLSGLKSLHPAIILVIVCGFIECVTELTSNVAVANIILPVLAEMSRAVHVNPLYLMLPAAFCCSFSFHLPVGTPPNAIVSAAGHIKTKDFIIAGIGPSVITLIITVSTWNIWGVYVFDLHGYPEWAESEIPSLIT